MLRAITVISSQRALPFAFFARRLIFFALVLRSFCATAFSSSFTALCAYSYAPSDAIITVSPFSSCPSHEGVASWYSGRQSRLFYFEQLAVLTANHGRCRSRLIKDRLAGIQVYFYYIERCERLVMKTLKGEEFTSLKAL